MRVRIRYITRGTMVVWLECLAGNEKVAGSRYVPAVIVSRDLERVLYSLLLLRFGLTYS